MVKMVPPERPHAVTVSSKLVRLLKENSSFLIVCHINPEGDAIGSILALALGLKKTGKKDICLLCKDPVPENLRFLPFSRLVRQKPPKKIYDVLIIVDCNTLERTGFKDLRAKKTIIIDHHLPPADADRSELYRSLSASLIRPDAAATGILIYHVLSVLKIPLDKDIATNLYTAILIDTGGFRYSNTSPESLKSACHLVRAGAQ
ncbi:MAG: DHH family phosphoesterase, partial [Nitrospirae bacterium]|nr:DHH family phosphoesterase [Nitrospirota bacterium]